MASEFKEGMLKVFKGLVAQISEPVFTSSMRTDVAQLRQYFAPRGDNPFMSTYSYGTAEHDYYRQYFTGGVSPHTLNPTPYETVKRSVSGFMSYHHTPYEKFFKTDIFNYDAAIMDDKELLRRNALHWKAMDNATHAVMQQPQNIMQEALFIMDRLVFNIGIKTLDLDSNLGVKKTTHPVENLIYFSSNGVDLDIQGVVEDLSWFQYKMRYKEQVMPLSDSNQVAYDRAFSLNPFDSNSEYVEKDVKVYRLNIASKVFTNWIKGYMLSNGLDTLVSMWERNYKKEYGIKDDSIIDLTINEFGDIINIVSRDYRTVIVGHLGFVTKDGLRGKSQGDVALGTAKILQETEEILINGYERAYGPAFFIPSALDAEVAQLIGRDEFIFTDDPEAVKPLVIPIDMNTALAVAKDWEERLRNLFFLDVFSLIEKNRMPINEISMRRADGFKQLGLFVAADTQSSLEPEVLSIRKMYLEDKFPAAPVRDSKVRVSYISPIIQAIKSSSLDEHSRILNIGTAVEQIAQGTMNKVMDAEEVMFDVFKKTDKMDFMKSAQQREEIAAQEAQAQKLAVLKAQADARKSNTDSLMGLAQGLNIGGEGGAAGAAG